MSDKLALRLKALAELRKADVLTTPYFFVYGSLMERYKNFNRFIRRQVTSIQPAYCQGLLYHLPIGFPGLIILDGCQDIVFGELMTFKRPEKTMKALDQLESYYPDNFQKSIYIRKKLSIVVETNTNPREFQEEEAWVYTYPIEHLTPEHQKEFLISCGSWKLLSEQPQIKEAQRIRNLFRRMKKVPEPQHVHIEPALCIDEHLHERWSQSLACEKFCKNPHLCQHNSRKRIENF
ncbi:MAG: gamma-glutamylcyclotransferase [Deltaproteobacteria bacterium]|nr:gamma-glutamylcyclotransferase [Candidatus Anaeroferrophillus wilburensis]MBN2888932.1 gamma-glutamylcyclotransferase [Deltaproteobacteria bacterium]